MIVHRLIVTALALACCEQCLPGAITFDASGLATAVGADQYWPSQRCGPGGAACVHAASSQPIEEWHFRSLGKGIYQKGVAVWASPAVAVVGGRPLVFVGGCDHTMHALDLLAKQRLWFKVTNGAIRDAAVVGEVAGRAAVIWGSSDRFVYAHDAATGQPLWSRELVAATATQGDVDVAAPLVHDGIVYVACFVYDKAFATNRQQAILSALDAATGTVFWSQAIDTGPVNAPAGREIDGRFVLFLAARKGLVRALAVSRQGPSPLWTFQMPHEVLASPAVEPDGVAPAVFLGSKFGDLIAIDARTGVQRWRRMTGNWVDNNACVTRLNGENVVFVGSYDRCVYALRASDGGELWRRRLGSEVFSAPSVFQVAGQMRVAVACLDNHLVVLDAAGGAVETCYYVGEPQWDSISKGETLWSSPAVLQAGDATVLIHGSYDGVVYVLPLRASVLEVSPWRPWQIWVEMAAVLVLFCAAATIVRLRQLGHRQRPVASRY